MKFYNHSVNYLLILNLLLFIIHSINTSRGSFMNLNWETLMNKEYHYITYDIYYYFVLNIMFLTLKERKIL